MVTDYLKDKTQLITFEIQVVICENKKYFSLQYPSEISDSGISYYPKRMLIPYFDSNLAHMADADILIKRKGEIIHTGSITWVGTHGAHSQFNDLEKYMGDPEGGQTSKLVCADNFEVGDILQFLLPHHLRDAEKEFMESIERQGAPWKASWPWIKFFFEVAR